MCCRDCSVFNMCACLCVCVCVRVQPVPVQAGSSASDTRFVRQDKVYRWVWQWHNWGEGDTTHTQPFYGSMDFVRDNPGELVPEETFTHYTHRGHQSSLICFIHLLYGILVSRGGENWWQLQQMKNNFLKIHSLIDSPRNSLYSCDRDFHLTFTVFLHYLVKFENLE